MSRSRYAPAVVIGSVALLNSARLARTHRVRAGEERIFRLANDLPDPLHIPVWAVMQSGSLAAVFVVATDALRRREPVTAATALIAGTVVWGGVKAVKPKIGRGRPAHHLDSVSVRGQAQTGLGYPSGHAAVSLTLALVATRSMSPGRRAKAIAVSAFTGVARMYVGAHLPQDLVGGYSLGLLSGLAANSVARKLDAGSTMR